MDFLLPKLSATMETAKVGRWLKQAGDSVRLGEPLVELETDKAAMEVESPVEGTVDALLAKEGDEVPVGQVLARLRTAGEALTPAAVTAIAPKAPPSPANDSKPTAAVGRSSTSRPEAKRLLASPLAKRLGRMHGIELAGVSGSGPNGRVRKRDVLKAADLKARAPATGVQSPAGVAEPLSAIRTQIAQAVTLSRQTIPSFVLDRWVETTAIEAARGEVGPDVERTTGIKLTLTDFLLQALADSLAASPDMLDRWHEENGRSGRIRTSAVDIGLVVAVTDGVMIPVLRDLKGKSLGVIAKTRSAAVQRARSGRLSAADYAPVSISLSNIGKSGADRFEAIINPGQSSILAIGRQHERVVARGGAIAINNGVNLTLSVDHRLNDGLAGAEFLAILADRIQLGPWLPN